MTLNSCSSGVGSSSLGNDQIVDNRIVNYFKTSCKLLHFSLYKQGSYLNLGEIARLAAADKKTYLWTLSIWEARKNIDAAKIDEGQTRKTPLRLPQNFPTIGLQPESLQYWATRVRNLEHYKKLRDQVLIDLNNNVAKKSVRISFLSNHHLVCGHCLRPLPVWRLLSPINQEVPRMLSNNDRDFGLWPSRLPIPEEIDDGALTENTGCFHPRSFEKASLVGLWMLRTETIQLLPSFIQNGCEFYHSTEILSMWNKKENKFTCEFFQISSPMCSLFKYLPEIVKMTVNVGLKIDLEQQTVLYWVMHKPANFSDRRDLNNKMLERRIGMIRKAIQMLTSNESPEEIASASSSLSSLSSSSPSVSGALMPAKKKARTK